MLGESDYTVLHNSNAQPRGTDLILLLISGRLTKVPCIYCDIKLLYIQPFELTLAMPPITFVISPNLQSDNYLNFDGTTKFLLSRGPYGGNIFENPFLHFSSNFI